MHTDRMRTELRFISAIIICAFFACAAPPGFVTRDGAQLLLDGQPYRAVGTNMYWLGLDENENGVHYPTHYRITDGLETAAALGWRVVRGHTLGISTGNSLSFEPSFGVFNENALDAADWAIAEATRLGIKLIIPLTDNWRYYHGGKHDFTTFVGEPDETKFFTNPAAIAAFHDFVVRRLNHSNAYTGRRTADEPAVLCWESGNEFSSPPAAWTATLAQLIKSIAPNHLVLDGSNGIVDESLASPAVDVYSQHFYPADASAMSAAAVKVAGASKVFINGEFGWDDGGSSPAAFLDAFIAAPAAVTAFWSLFPHADWSGFVNHSDGFTVHYPGATPAMVALIDTARAHAAAAAGLPSPKPLPAPLAPAVTNITRSAGYASALAWRGAALAVDYALQAAPALAGPWTDVCTSCGDDYDTPVPVPAHTVAVGSYVRVRGVNADGLQGAWSDPTLV